MLIASPALFRELKTVDLAADLVVIGGGMAGVCAAVTAARLGQQVVLIHDRPVLGGNASSEIRLWVLGAAAIMNSNNRWAREGGLLNELLLENIWRNPEGNPVIWDTVLLEKAVAEPNLTLLLNTACFACEKATDNPDRITSVEAFCSQNSTRYVARAPLFCDASGDGVLGFLAGAAFRMGAEAREEFDEPFARGDDFGHLLGHSIYFYTKDTGRPVSFVAPSYALKDVEQKIPRFRQFKAKEDGCRLWWIEWGGRLDTVHDTEQIKWELWRIVYGVWNYVKNSGRFPEAKNLTLEWVGSIPGKRESRRFEGDYMLSQRDIVERRRHDDAVTYGGWSIDLHPADGVYAHVAGSHHLQSKGIYAIPYRCYYSRNVENLFLAGRIISATHVAFGSSRVMGTCALGGQAVAVAAALCKTRAALPRDLAQGEGLMQLRRELLGLGQHLPGLPLDDPDDQARRATVTTSSEFLLGSFPADAAPVALNVARAQLLPLSAGPVPVFTVVLDVDQPTELVAELRIPSDPRHHTPDVLIGTVRIPLTSGFRQEVVLSFPAQLPEPAYGFIVLNAVPGVRWHTSRQRVTGVLSLYRSHAEKLTAVGGEDFDIFRPERRPAGRNFAIRCEPPLRPFRPENVLNGFHRPTHQTNAWVAAPDDAAPRITLTWDSPQELTEVVVGFDVDYDHPLESVLFGHPEYAMPFCVRHCRLLADDGRILHEVADNHHSHLRVRFAVPVTVRALHIEVVSTHGAPAAVMEARAYSRNLRQS